jgi:hypothetical protein
MWTVVTSATKGNQMQPTSDPSRTDQRIPLVDIAAGRVRIRLGQGRVELGRSRGDSVRLRTTATGTRGISAHSVRLRRGELRIAAPHGRLQVDLPDGLAGELVVLVKVKRGEITSWGAGGELELGCRRGRVTCRELVAGRVRARASRVSLHFAEPPKRVRIDAGSATVSVPAGAYAVTAPRGAEITVTQQPDSDRRILVRAAEVRILAAQTPLSLTDEAGRGS